MNQEVNASEASQSQHMNHLMATAGEVSGDGKQGVMSGVGGSVGNNDEVTQHCHKQEV